METTNVLHIENQTNKKETKSTEQDDTKKKLSNFCLDVAKYIFTGIFLTTFFLWMEDVFWVLFICGILIIGFILIGITFNKQKYER